MPDSSWMMNHQGRPVLHMNVGKTQYPHADRRKNHVPNTVIHGLSFVAVPCRQCRARVVYRMIVRSTQTGFCPFAHRLQVRGMSDFFTFGSSRCAHALLSCNRGVSRLGSLVYRGCKHGFGPLAFQSICIISVCRGGLARLACARPSLCTSSPC